MTHSDRNDSVQYDAFSLDSAAQSVDEALLLSRKFLNAEWADIQEHMGLPLVVSGSGSTLLDAFGEKWTDMVCAFGAATLGHNSAVANNALKLALSANVVGIFPYSIRGDLGKLAEILDALAGSHGYQSLFLNTGCEAYEASLKVSRAFTGRTNILTVRNGYHGMSHEALRSSSSKIFKTGSRVRSQSTYVEVDDIDTLRQELSSERYAAFVFEPIQGVGGGDAWSLNNLAEIRRLCSLHKTLLITDEIFTGIFRTGHAFAWQRCGLDCIPDIILTSKGLTGGIIPISALMMSSEIAEQSISPSRNGVVYASTFAGNGYAASIAQAVLKEIQALNTNLILSSSSSKISDNVKLLMESYSVIKSVKSYGHLIFIELKACGLPLGFARQAFIVNLLKERLLVSQCAYAPNTVKLMPPLNVTLDDLNMLFEKLCRALSSFADDVLSVQE